MNVPPPFGRHGVFRLKNLPAEIRRRVYYFAIVQPHLIPLIAHYDNLATFITNQPSSVSVYATENDLRMLGTDQEFRKDMSDLLYSENSFYLSTLPTKPEREERVFRRVFRIDTTRIEKCHLYIEDMTAMSKFDDEDSDLDEYDRDDFLLNECYDIIPFVSTLVFKGYSLKYLLVECDSQECLQENLRPMAILRKIRLVHFRSCQTDVYPYFRFLEDIMMSNRPLPFDDWREYEVQVTPFPGASPTSTSMTGDMIVKSEEQMEATAKELYSILGIESDFKPQNELK